MTPPYLPARYRESAQSWKELLLDLKRRGLETGPALAVGDGALGFWKLLPATWARTSRTGTPRHSPSGRYSDDQPD